MQNSSPIKPVLTTCDKLLNSWKDSRVIPELEASLLIEAYEVLSLDRETDPVFLETLYKMCH